MLLRRVIEHVKAQNWTAVALDFVIVVVGVFMGIQVDAWNQDRIARAEERGYLERLREDLAVSIERNNFQTAFMRRHAGYATIVLEDLARCAIADEHRDAFANGLYHFGKSTPIIYTRGAYNELISTGKLDLIQNIEIRRQLDKLSQLVEEADAISKKIDIRAAPHQAYVESQFLVDIRDAVDGRENVDPSQVKFDLDALCEDRRFSTAVNMVRYMMYDLVGRHEMIVAEQEEVRELIERQLGIEPEEAD